MVAAAAVLLLGWWLGRLGFLRALELARRPPAVVRRFGGWARSHPLRAQAKLRWPRAYGVLARRLEPRSFRGLPLTLMALAALYAAALFGGLVAELREAEELQRFDTAVDRLFAGWRGGPLERLFLWTTVLGDSAALVAVSLTATGLLWAHRRTRLLFPLWLVILGAHATTWAGKLILARQRPEFVTAATALSPSFPSAHATGAMAVYGFLAYAMARELDDAGRRFDVAYWTLVLVAAVGFSRVFLSVHYASDVAAGFLVGGFWLLVGFTVAEWTRPRVSASR